MCAAEKHAAQRRWLNPTWRRLAITVLIAILGFFIPQSHLITWYPLNEPGDDLLYLEIVCQADSPGDVVISLGIGDRGHRADESLRWPIAATTHAYTYTFPLQDAPLAEFRLSSPPGASITIHRMRVLDRRGREIRRISIDQFIVVPPTSLTALTDGWRLSSPMNAIGEAHIHLYSPIIANKLNARNLMRCALSVGYLALILFVLLLAGTLSQAPLQTSRSWVNYATFLVIVAVSFSAVGNRRLIRESLSYASYPALASSANFRLEIDLDGQVASPLQVFWDLGAGFNEADSIRAELAPRRGIQTLRLNLPSQELQAVRLDPGDGETQLVLRGLRVTDNHYNTRAILPLDAFHPVRHIAHYQAGPGFVEIASTTNASDPILNLRPDVVACINAATAQAFSK